MLVGSTAAACALVFGVFLQPAVTQALGILPDAWMQDRYYRYYGVITGFMTNLTNLEIAKQLFVSEDTVKTHARRLFRKLGANDRAHAVALGMRYELVG